MQGFKFERTFVWNRYFGTPEEDAAEAARKADEAKRSSFTEEQQKLFNDALAKERGETERKFKKQLEDSIKAANTTAEQRKALEQQLEELKTVSMTEAQKNQLALQKAEDERKREVTALKEERDHWRGLFTNNTIEREISDAAGEEKAYRPRQVVNLFKKDAVLKPVTDSDGKETGDFSVKIRFSDIDPKTKQPVVTDLTPKELVKRIKEIDDYQNLFAAVNGNGLGLNSGSPTRRTGEPILDTDEYIKNRNREKGRK